jgi:hypothetical protein
VRRVCPECGRPVRDDPEDDDWVVCRFGHRIERVNVRRD